MDEELRLAASAVRRLHGPTDPLGALLQRAHTSLRELVAATEELLDAPPGPVMVEARARVRRALREVRK